MKKLTILTIICCLFASPLVKAQQAEKEKQFGIKFSGFVKNDFFWDSRQTVAAREGHFLLWPAAQSLDDAGADINARPNFNFLAVQSRLKGTITGPDALGARTSGLIEGDFFAQANDNINLFRLRHAFIKLNWENTEVMTGQYWNPLFVTACFPGTVSFNTGTPLQSFARNPQIRVTHKFGGLSIMAAALAQRDYSSRGPDPSDTTRRKSMVSTSYLRNANIPDMHIQVAYARKNDERGTSFLAGAGAAYKTLVPRLYDDHAAKTIVDEKTGGLTAIVFSKLVTKPITAKLQLRYGENTADLLSPSGFAVTAMVDDGSGVITQQYAPLRNATAWGEVHTNGSKFQAGVFAGYMVSMGIAEARQSVDYPVYGLATNIVSLLRVSPRCLYTAGKFKIGCEIEFTQTEFGSDFNLYYEVNGNISKVRNTRLLLSTIYSF